MLCCLSIRLLLFKHKKITSIVFQVCVRHLGHPNEATTEMAPQRAWGTSESAPQSSESLSEFGASSLGREWVV